LAKLAERCGNEPITIVEIDWVDGKTTAYADRTIGPIPGRIVEVGDLDDAVNVSGNSGSQELALTLDDTDGTIKTILDAHDVHKRDARVYQYFTGLDLSDRFLLFSGKLSSPIIWNERDRTVKVTILSQLEDREIGFSAEEGQFEYLPAEMVNKPWPIIFGTVINNPCLAIVPAITGTTLTPVGILDGAEQMLLLPTSNDVDFEISLARGNEELKHLQKVINCYTGIDDAKVAQYQKQYDALFEQLRNAVIDYNSRQECTRLRRQKKIDEANVNGLGDDPIRILGGEDFPQGRTVTIAIEGGLFTGYFEGSNFHVYSRNNEELTEKAWGAFNAKLKDKDVCSLNNTELKNYWHWETPVPCGTGDFGNDCVVSDSVWLFTQITEDAIADRQPVIQQFWVEPGAEATLYTGESKAYIASITPGTVLAVRAYKQVTSGQTRLVDVPTDLYTITTAAYGTITAIQIELAKPLSHIMDEGWQDDLFVTFQSSVGPNVADILAYIIDQYTDLECDADSFAYVRTKLAAFPANFPINERKNVLQAIQEIAFQARCAIWFTEGVVHLQYLPEEPTPVDTITVSDVDAEKGVEVELTSTEELVTKMVVNWHLRFATDDRPYSVTLRHSLKKYGTHEQDYNFYIFNQPDIIYKMATFWLIRKSNTWKRIRFTTPLHKLNLETFDAVTLDFAEPYVASSPITAIIERAKYNSATNAIDFVCLTPVVAGSVTKYPYFWPSALPASMTWPPQSDIADGFAGAGGVGSGASGPLAIGDTSTIVGGSPVFVGGPNIVFGPHSDWGDPRPTDVGFTAQATVAAADYAGSNVRSRAPLDLTVDYSEPMVPLKDAAALADDVTIDINRTKVYDMSSGKRQEGLLSALIKRINEDGKLVLDGGVPIAADGVEKSFDFKYDETGDKLGAGTAFLQD
jgi:hypothetical protein